jgi:hypothetical protein
MIFRLEKYSSLLLFERVISVSLVITYVPTWFIVLIHVIGKLEFASDRLQYIVNEFRASPINRVAFELMDSEKKISNCK